MVVAYGLLLPKPILEAPRFGALNGHGSLLPRWRGAAPIQRAIEAGDTVTGMMVMGMEAGLDTGPVALTQEVAIGPTDTAREVHDRLSAASAALMVEAMTRLEDGSLRFETQDAIAARTGREVKYAAKIEKGEAAVDWSRPAAEIARRINAFSPFPGAWTFLSGERLKLLRAAAEEGRGEPGTALDDALLVAAGEGAVRLLEVQKAGGKASDAAGFLRGAKVPPARASAPDAMPRYKLTIEYDGSTYCGWQRQKNGISVQETVERAFSPSAARRSPCSARDARMPASTRPGRSPMSTSPGAGRPIRCATRSMRIFARRGALPSSPPRRCRTRSTRVSRPASGTISTASSTAARRPRS